LTRQLGTDKFYVKNWSNHNEEKKNRVAWSNSCGDFARPGSRLDDSFSGNFDEVSDELEVWFEFVVLTMVGSVLG
jgi:hypothetical protein